MIKLSVKRPLTIFVIVIIIIVLGYVSFTGMTTDLLPSVNLPYIVVITSYPGAAPEEVESAVTEPLEDALAGTGNLQNITSESAENVSMVMLEFTQDANIDSLSVEVSQSLNAISGEWDDSIGAPYMIKMNPNMLPVMISAVSYDGMSTAGLSDFASDELLSRLETAEGVATVSAQGIVEEELTVTISGEKIEEINKLMVKSVNEDLAEAQDALDDAQQEINEGYDRLDSTYAEQKSQLDAAQSALAEGQTELDANEALMTETERQLSEAETQLNVSYVLVNTQKGELSTQKAELLVNRAELEAMPDFPDKAAQLAQIDTAVAAIDSELAKLDAQTAGLDANAQQLAQSRAEFEAGKTQLEAGKTELAAQREGIEVAKSQLESGISSARSQLNSAQDTLDTQSTALTDARDAALEQASIDGVITVNMVSQILAAQNFSMPAGYVDDNGVDTVVKIEGDIESADELGDLLLFELGLEYVDEVRLSDVADVALADNSSELYAKLNGEDGVVFVFSRQSTYSTTEVTDSIKEVMAELEAEYPGLSFVNMMDQGIYIDMIIETVIINLLMGAVLAVIVLFVFLRSIKPTFIVAVSIPISVVFAIALMYFSGVTLNMISLAGLALGVGMLVDNSIVVIENTYRLRSRGMSVVRAALFGAKEMGPAITASTLTTISVFLPIMFTDGITRELFTDMALTIAYSLIASLLVALTVVPAMSSVMLGKIKTVNAGSKFGYAVLNGYEKLARWALRFKPVVIIAIVFAFGASAYLSFAKGAILLPEMESTQMTATFSFPEGTTQEEQFETIDSIAAGIYEMDDVEAVGVIFAGGTGSMPFLTGGGGSNEYSAYIMLKEDKVKSTDEIGKDILAASEAFDVETVVSGADMDTDSLTGASGVEVTVTGRDIDDMMTAASDIAEIVEGVPGTMNVDTGVGETSREIRIVVDKSKAMAKGLTAAQVYQSVAEQISEGYTATNIYEAGSDYPAVVVDEKAFGINAGNIGDMEIPLPETAGVAENENAFAFDEISDTEDTEESAEDDGLEDTEEELDYVLLSDIAEIVSGESPDAISRDSQKRILRVSGRVDSSYNISQVSAAVESRLEDYTAPEGVDVEFTGESNTIMETIFDMAYIMLIAIVLIYLIMVVQFQSLKSPFIVMFTVPLAFTGGFIALILCGFEISMIALLGMLLLAGVVVNNGIVLVDTINRNRLSGMERREAIVEAGKTRMRPILMTALTTIFGLATLSMGMGTGADILQPMAAVVIGGLLYSTILTLVFIPVIYDIVNKKELKRVELEEDENA